MIIVQRPAPKNQALETLRKNVTEDMSELNSSTDAKTVNLVDLFDQGSATNSASDPDPVGFNSHEIGSPEWLAQGKKDGVWVDGISLEEILNTNNDLSDSDVKNLMRGIHALSESLQSFQNEMAQLVQQGASDAQLKSFATTALATGNQTLTNKDLNDGVEGDVAKYLPGLLYKKFLSTPANKMKDMFNSFREGDGIDNAHSAETAINKMDWSDRFKEARATAEIEAYDPDSQRNSVHSDGMRVLQDYRDDIAALPAELQAEAWEFVNAELERVVDAAGDDGSNSLPDVPEFQQDHIAFGPTNNKKARERVAQRGELYGRIYA